MNKTKNFKIFFLHLLYNQTNKQYYCLKYTQQKKTVSSMFKSKKKKVIRLKIKVQKKTAFFFFFLHHFLSSLKSFFKNFLCREKNFFFSTKSDQFWSIKKKRKISNKFSHINWLTSLTFQMIYGKKKKTKHCNKLIYTIFQLLYLIAKNK